MKPTSFTILLFTVTISGCDDAFEITTILGAYDANFETSTADYEIPTIGPENLQNQSDEIISPTNEISSGDESHDVENPDSDDVEIMQLSVQNCNREIILTENSKQIAFNFTQDAAKERGQCQITIHGSKDGVLVLVFSNIRLSKKRQDSLKIVTRIGNVSLTMKEFNDDENLSVLLPNVSTAYLIYSYHRLNTSIEEDDQACFFLNVFSIFLYKKM